MGTSDMSVNFACAQIIGPNGTVLYVPGQVNINNITCGVSPGMTTVSTDPNNPTEVTVTISSSSGLRSELWMPSRILGLFCMGMPAIVLLGSLRFRKLSRTRILQILGLMLVSFALLWSPWGWRRIHPTSGWQHTAGFVPDGGCGNNLGRCADFGCRSVRR